MAALPEAPYLTKLGTVTYLVSGIEGLLVFDLPRLQLLHGLPHELDPTVLAGETTWKIGSLLVKHSKKCSDQSTAAYLQAGGRALVEIAPLRNAILHARPATDPEGQQRLYRWRLTKTQQEAHFVDDGYLDRLIERLETIARELNSARPRF